ncbi:MAG: hypothetical protein OK457_00640 [Thaumarchaeota archaeon]|nr:hypothetical protein [Nitrososphaerota archaeon]
MTRDEHLLVKLMEECAEVAQRASKSLQFGSEEVQNGQFLNNKERLRTEVNDLLTVIKMLEEEGEFLESISPFRVKAAMALKRKKIQKYLDLSISLGRVQA